MRLSLFVPVALLLLAPAAASAQCAFSAERSATLPASGSTLGRIVAKAGNLRIEGRTGLQEVRARGRACASSAAALALVTIRAERVGQEARITTEMPDDDDLRNGYAWLDLVIEVPASLGLHVTDSSGDAHIRGVAGLTIQDSSGDLRIEDLTGSLDATDSSGDLVAEGIRGDVRLHDSSGDLRVRDVSGGVLVENDSSGDIDVSGVGGDFEVRRDSSGDIVATAVRGNFTVGRAGSGGIRHRDIAGQVRLPERR